MPISTPQNTLNNQSVYTLRVGVIEYKCIREKGYLKNEHDNGKSLYSEGKKQKHTPLSALAGIG